VRLSTARFLLREARVGYLGTITRDGGPHVVPCCFALSGEVFYSAVDAKPKSTQDLRRLDNLRAHGTATLVVDHYEEDWTKLWWVRVDCTGRVVDTSEERARALGFLRAKYDQYRSVPPSGPVMAFEIENWRSWPDTDPAGLVLGGDNEARTSNPREGKC
jgi:PPOX class probable F420-dependent enzyme